ncbi:hypothetical protein HZA55_07110 [Candidatus Poribacteria bacterium]|nr:hypothetical protein [Candidatus Poribacteria bacterium]
MQPEFDKKSFFNLRKRFRLMAQKARRIEVVNVGHAPLTSLPVYTQAIKIGWDIIKILNPNIIKN